MFIAGGVTGGRFLFGRRGRADSPPGTDVAVAQAPVPPTNALPAVTPPGARVVDSFTPTPRSAAVAPTVATAQPPVGGPAISPVALPPLNAWTRAGSMSGTWNVNAAGVATARVTDGASMLMSPTSFTDVELYAELSTPNREASLAVRVRDHSSAYLAVFVPDGAAHLKGRGGSVSIVKVVDGTLTQLATGRLPAMVQIRDSVRMRLQARGQNLTLFMNGREVARATDATYAEGKVGLRVFADADGPCDATFTNVRVGLS